MEEVKSGTEQEAADAANETPEPQSDDTQSEAPATEESGEQPTE